MEPVNPTFEPSIVPDGVPVVFPKNCEAAEAPIVVDLESSDDMDAIYEIMERTYSSGEIDTAARHNEHQP